MTAPLPHEVWHVAGVEEATAGGAFGSYRHGCHAACAIHASATPTCLINHERELLHLSNSEKNLDCRLIKGLEATKGPLCHPTADLEMPVRIK